ncbi:MAG: DNA polymerase I [Bacilli bacterium]|nr:DNA polymerase I [Bacilli bacterium]
MKKVILVDGNNLLFRSYYATAYRGPILRNSKGFPTNGLYGFINMLNKIISEEDPSYMMIAFDKGKTFRHEKYDGYKDGRRETPDELKMQFPVAKEIAKAMGIPCFEIDNYEADDIIGTFAKEVDKRDDFISTIISSDKDLLQLISSDNEVKLLKTNDYIRMNEKTFVETYGFSPLQMVDLKGLMGDSSDNIPGVKGIGEKTAIKLIQDYGTIENLYDHIDEIKGKMKEKLLNDKDNAFFSKELATIYRDVPIDKDLDKIKYNGSTPKLIPLMKEYEFFSLLKKLDIKEEKEEVDYEVLDSINIDIDSAIYIECEGNYHDNKIIGLGIVNKKGSYYLEKDSIKNISFGKDINLYTYDLKKLLILLKLNGIVLDNKTDDLNIETYILNYPIKEDISYLMSIAGYSSIETEELLKKKDKIDKKEFSDNIVKKTKFIFENRTKYYEELIKKDFLSIYEDIDLPLCYVLASMEYEGVSVDKNYLLKMKDEVNKKIEDLEKEIHTLANNDEFNINSPKQLGVVLFEDLGMPYPKKVKADKSYSTSVDILNKLKDYEIVDKILEYRTLTKLYSNYIVGLMDFIKEDGKIHTIFNETLTRTGRLSSTSPNLQNIPIREDYGRLIRKAFIPSFNSVIISSDYSQIELRVFAHMSNAENLIEAFKNDMDIHTKTAMDIYHIEKDKVTPRLRRNAKAVNFGILYGISSFGLSEDLGINVKEAKDFIDNYLETYPGIKDYMESLKKDAYANGYVKTLFGRERVIDELSSNNFMVRSSGERMALNTPIQGTSADIIKIAMVNLYNEFKKQKIKAKLIIQVHDELLIDCPKDELDKVKEILQNKMENACKLKVPLKVDINYGNNWYEAK